MAEEENQKLKETIESQKEELHQAQAVHMQFVCRMYKLQHEEGRYFFCMKTV